MSNKPITGAEVVQAWKELQEQRLKRLETLAEAFQTELEGQVWIPSELDAKAKPYLKSPILRPDLEEMRFMAVVDRLTDNIEINLPEEF